MKKILVLLIATLLFLSLPCVADASATENSLWVLYFASQKKQAPDELSAFAASVAGTPSDADEFARKAAADSALADVKSRIATSKKDVRYGVDTMIELGEFDFQRKVFPVRLKSTVASEKAGALPPLFLIVGSAYHLGGTVSMSVSEAQAFLKTADPYRRVKAHVSCASFLPLDVKKSGIVHADFALEDPTSALEFMGQGNPRFLLCTKPKIAVDSAGHQAEVRLKN